MIDLVGVVYPFIASVYALHTDGKDDDEQWLTYWLIYAVFKVFETSLDVFISFLPFYWFFKVGFLVWCYYPKGEGKDSGAKVVYQMIVKPYLTEWVVSIMEDPSKKKD